MKTMFGLIKLEPRPSRSFNGSICEGPPSVVICISVSGTAGFGDEVDFKNDS